MAREMDEDDPRYIPENLVESLKAERSVLNPGQTQEMQTKEIFLEHAAAAATTIAHIAIHGTTERVRLDASKYVVERVIGRVGDDTGATDPLTEFMKGLSAEAEAFANKNGN
jgi:hypothetical protein